METDVDWEWEGGLPDFGSFEVICETERAVLLGYQGRKFWCPKRTFQAWIDEKSWAVRWAERNLKPLMKDDRARTPSRDGGSFFKGMRKRVPTAISEATA